MGEDKESDERNKKLDMSLIDIKRCKWSNIMFLRLSKPMSMKNQMK